MYSSVWPDHFLQWGLTTDVRIHPGQIRMRNWQKTDEKPWWRDKPDYFTVLFWLCYFLKKGKEKKRNERKWLA